MLTPQEIQDTKFEKAVFGGYDMAQIDKFLDDLLVDYTLLYKENAALKGKMRVLVDKIDEYRAVDEEMRKALYTAQVTAKEIKDKAEAEAKKTIADAEAEAKRRGENIEAEVYANALRLKEMRGTCAKYAQGAIEIFNRAMQEIAVLDNEDADKYIKQAMSEINKSRGAESFEIDLPADVKPDEEESAMPDEPTREIELGDDAQEEAAEETQAINLNISHSEENEEEQEPSSSKMKFNFTNLKFGRDYDNQD